MKEAKFVVSKRIIKEQVDKLKNLGLKVSYSYKTNRNVGKLLQDLDSDVDFSIHVKEELGDIIDKNKIWFFVQAESVDELLELFNFGVKKFVVDNLVDYERVVDVAKKKGKKIWLSLRMKFQEHRIGTGKYFVYGMSSKKVNELIQNTNRNFVEKLGVHIHRKSQNTSEWEIVDELKDSFGEISFSKIDFINFGGGLPSTYRNSSVDVLPYIFEKLNDAVEFLKENGVESYIEPGRFVCAPAVKLETEIIQINERNIVINTSIYNCALDTVLTGTKLLVEGEGDGEDYLIKGNSPTRDDIFRYNVKLKSPKVGQRLVFLNAGAYNYSTDFFGYHPLKVEYIDQF